MRFSFSNRFTRALSLVLVLLLNKETAAIRDTGETGDDLAILSSTESTKTAPPYSILRFPRIPPSAWGPRNDSAAFVELKAQSDGASSSLTDERRALSWEAEKDYFKQQPAVEDSYIHTAKVYSAQTLGVQDVVDQLLSQTVPGISETFQAVFQYMIDNDCPVWLVGGTVRDILAGKPPNDVDAVVLASPDALMEILLAKRQDWNPYMDNHYWNIGDPDPAENPNYLEGFTLEMLFGSPFTAETSVNCLLFSVSSGYVIDPTGHGVTDARDQILRPGGPRPSDFEAPEPTQWLLWREWTFHAFAAPPHQRHVRYIKMRLRDWTPYCPCFQVFMANQLLGMAHIEAGGLPESKQIEDDRWPYSTIGMLSMLEKYMSADDPEIGWDTVVKLFKIYKQDTAIYFDSSANAEAIRQECTGGDTTVLLKDSLGATSFLDIIHVGLVSLCSKPTQAAVDAGRSYAHIEKFTHACAHILKLWAQLAGSRKTPRNYYEPRTTRQTAALCFSSIWEATGISAQWRQSAPATVPLLDVPAELSDDVSLLTPRAVRPDFDPWEIQPYGGPDLEFEEMMDGAVATPNTTAQGGNSSKVTAPIAAANQSLDAGHAAGTAGT